jgi:hypothetical protein
MWSRRTCSHFKGSARQVQTLVKQRDAHIRLCSALPGTGETTRLFLPHAGGSLFGCYFTHLLRRMGLDERWLASVLDLY